MWKSKIFLEVCDSQIWLNHASNLLAPELLVNQTFALLASFGGIPRLHLGLLSGQVWEVHGEEEREICSYCFQMWQVPEKPTELVSDSRWSWMEGHYESECPLSTSPLPLHCMWTSSSIAQSRNLRLIFPEEKPHLPRALKKFTTFICKKNFTDVMLAFCFKPQA